VSDPIEVVMEEALRPGRYVSEHASFSLVDELQSVAGFRAAARHPARRIDVRYG